jgi:hypothetical protein
VAIERQRRGAVVADLGGKWLVRRFALMRTHSRNTAEYMARKAADLASQVGASRLVVEAHTGYRDQLVALGHDPEEISISEVKHLVLPVASLPTHGELCRAVVDVHPALARYGIDKRSGVRSFDVPDRWRTVVLLAAAFVLAAKRGGTSTNLNQHL